jgi:translin
MADDLDLSAIEAEVRSQLDATYAAREEGLRLARPIIRTSANAIRAMHRGDRDDALRLVAEAKGLVASAQEALADHPDIYHAGFLYDAVKEYAEAELTIALLTGEPLPAPSTIGVDAVPFCKGLGEAVGEQRRRMLDQLRTGDLDAAERTFGNMEQIHDLLASLDYPDGMTGALRRTTDVARSLIERSRADLTTTIVQERLRADLEAR